MNKPLNYFGFAFDEEISEKRRNELQKELQENGFDSSELWNLDFTIAKFVLPRLKAYIEADPVVGINHAGLGDTLYALQVIIDKCEKGIMDWDVERYKNGMKVFAEEFHGLWC